MKTKLLLTILSLFATSIVFSQSRYLFGYTSSSHTNYDITHLGNISLGEIVDPDGPIFNIYQDDNTNITIKNAHGKLQIGIANGNNAFAPTSKQGTTVFRTLGTSHNLIFNIPDDNNDGNSNIRINDNHNYSSFVVFNNGKVTIGTENFDQEDYNLYVKNGIKTEKIKVEFANVNGWADYVFEPTYNLKSLDELKIFINKNNHLPEVPTAQHVVENGVELKKMNVLLLKKIEELTLYIIKLNEKNEENNLRIIEIEKKMNTVSLLKDN